MDLTFVLADIQKQNQNRIQTEIRRLASFRDFTYRMFSVSQPKAWEKIASEDFCTVCIGFVCMDYPDADLLGMRLYQANPFCRLIYYAEGSRDVVPVLPSRPVRYLDITKGVQEIRSCILEEYNAWLQDTHCFHYEDRYQSISVHYGSISYFCSRNRMVYFWSGTQEIGPLRRTLDQIEEMLPTACFLRCHKSFLVRRDACVLLDKNAKELLLNDGQRVPVSRAYWNGIMEQFSPKC